MSNTNDTSNTSDADDAVVEQPESGRRSKPRKSRAEKEADVKASGREWHEPRRRGKQPGRTREAYLADREEMARRYMRGESQYKIAAEMGFSQQAVSYNISKCRKEWIANSQQLIGERTMLELAKIDEVERSAWEGWLRSCKDSEKLVSETNTGGDKPGTKERVEIEPQAGDPRFLDVVLKCVQQRCKILGLDAPTKVEDVTPVRTVEVLVKSHDEVLEVNDLLASNPNNRISTHPHAGSPVTPDAN